MTISEEDLADFLWQFVTMLGIKTTATVSGYDCDDKPIATLTRGRWGVYQRLDAGSGDMLPQLGGYEL